MSAQQRASIFPDAGDDLPDLSDFTPTPRAARPRSEKAAIREVAERKGFTSREPEREVVASPPGPVAAPARVPRRHTTGRNRQLNLKVTENALTRFYELADRQGWVLGQAFEQAVEALEAKLASEA